MNVVAAAPSRTSSTAFSIRLYERPFVSPWVKLFDQSEYDFGTISYFLGVNQYSVLPSSYIRSRIYFFQHGVVGSIPASMYCVVYKKRCTVRCWICPAIKKRRREPGRDGISSVKQVAAHKGFCCTFLLYRPLRSLEQFRTQGFLRIESTAVKRCARKSTEFASGSNIVGESRGRWNIPYWNRIPRIEVLLNIPDVHV